MSNPESIVPPVELCKQIPAGEFTDTALVWVDDQDGIETVLPRDVAQFKLFDVYHMAPAPTLEEIITTLLAYGWLVKTDSRPGLEAFVELYSRTNNMRYAEHAKIACEAALRLWFKVKGINLE